MSEKRQELDKRRSGAKWEIDDILKELKAEELEAMRVVKEFWRGKQNE